MFTQVLLPALKKLAVKSTNTMLLLSKLYQMGQDRGEPIRVYLSRLGGAASNCNFEVKCSSCDEKTSYVEKALSHQLMKGLVDPEIQERILAKSGDRTKEMTLQEILQTVLALEASKRDETSLSGSRGGINRQRAGGDTPATGAEGGQKCSNCGSSRHKTKDPSCKAHEIICRGCVLLQEAGEPGQSVPDEAGDTRDTRGSRNGGAGTISTGQLGAVSSPGLGDTGGFFTMSSGLEPIGHHSWNKARKPGCPVLWVHTQCWR